MSLLSDGDSSNSSESAAASLMFGSHTVAPNSPTPYTDATQVRVIVTFCREQAECRYAMQVQFISP